MRTDLSSHSPLNRDPDHGPPVCPPPVVVAPLGIREQLVQDKPRVGAALADAAVGDDLAVGCDSLPLVKRPQLGVGQKGTGLRVDGLGPWDVLGAWDVAGLLGLLLREVR